ncbi:hypothetical protein AaE_014069 [Aphanomyces astaci]|uniref:Uncharacterized protein n=1 Tax=Aphanomyces astaci TaxID=112090 RepID=A0A6A4ZGI0_APHAT|nr:hypothetical protein AaE_014069 [Aphanomyces astaci]
MNWFEKGCVRAAPAFKRRTSQHDLMGDMLRQGHLSHRSASKLFEAPKSTVLEVLSIIVLDFMLADTFVMFAASPNYRSVEYRCARIVCVTGVPLPFPSQHLAALRRVCQRFVRFVPVHLHMTCFGDTYIGHILGAVSPTLSTSYAAGVKLAIGDYYNDQIREIYAELPEAPEAVPLKELFKTLRDASLADVERLFPSIEAAKQDAVAQYAKTITQVLLRPGSEV